MQTKKTRVKKLTVEIEVPYKAYSSKKKNRKADTQIAAFVKTTLQENLEFFELMVEEDNSPYGTMYHGLRYDHINLPKIRVK